MESGLGTDYWHGKDVVELGGGQGLVSLTAAALGADQVAMRRRCYKRRSLTKQVETYAIA
eukprot:scaffold319401_cov43-Prasinocladus_malaysianus.AAC.2